MSIAKLKSACAKRLLDASFFPVDQWKQENVGFTPPKDLPWMSDFFVPNQPSAVTLGTGGEDGLDGFYQVDLNYPLDSGDAEAAAKADDLRELFKAGDMLTYEGGVVRIRSCGRGQGRIVNNYFKISCTVYFYSHINR